jgi:cell division protein FtsA
MAMISNGRNKNNSAGNNKVIVGLDMGTSKICALVASPGEQEGQLNILGIGITESTGMQRGVVQNIARTIQSLEKAIDQAEQQSGVKIEEVVVGVAGDHIQSQTTRGIIGISNQSKIITQEDVIRVLEESRRIAVPSERRIIHVIPQEFIVDGQDGILDPIGFKGVRLEANVHLITGHASSIDNIYNCVESVGLKVREIVLEPIASSVAVLDEDEKEMGVALIDIGGGTTDLAIFRDGILRYSSIFAIAGRKVTDDIQRGLKILQRDAEKIKKDYGHTYLPGIMRDEMFMTAGINGRLPSEITKKVLCQIIQPRMEEIFELAMAEIRNSGYESLLSAGIVLTGGCSMVRGAEDLATDVFGMPVKIGQPSGITYSGLAPEVENPIYSTAVGLALYGLDKQIDYGEYRESLDKKKPVEEKRKLGKIWRVFENALHNL